eukprot:TRINITY_DN20315_c0_g1_i2.p1 TRINITY_DN20315_c0_g1~~TRINITY_DN20315_c0_g1_i2.p1  ORF type:complete len:272 (+),score=26.29 TRINITY_DN20315_c0_g1_i2:987-1802(+)
MAVPQDKRLGSIEEILHTNEMTVGNILGRLKDLELMLSQKARGQASAESVTVLGGEMMAAKQRLENLERSLNVGIQKLEDDVTKQSRQAGMQASKQATQASNELSDMRHHLAEVSGELKKIDSAVNNESRYAKQVEQDSRQALDLVTQQFNAQREQLLSHQQKIENAMQLVSLEAQERESLALSVKQAFEASLTTLNEQNRQYVQSEVQKRVQLTQDIVAAFKKLRDEIAAGFQRSMDGQQETERALKSVESILRAEIRSRMQVCISIQPM